jgi:hypothetical protein
MSSEDSRRFIEILTFVINLEHIGSSHARACLDDLRQFRGRVKDV